MFPLHITESLHLFQKAVEQKNYVHFKKLASTTTVSKNWKHHNQQVFFAKSVWPNSNISPTQISMKFQGISLPICYLFGVPKTRVIFFFATRFDLCICQLLSQRLTVGRRGGPPP